MPTLDDWVVKLRYEDSEVTEGLRALDSQMKRLGASNLVGQQEALKPRLPRQAPNRRFPDDRVKAEVEAYAEEDRRQEKAAKKRKTAERIARRERESEDRRRETERRRRVVEERRQQREKEQAASKLARQEKATQREKDRAFARENITPTAAGKRATRGRIETGISQAQSAISSLGNRTDEAAINLKEQLRARIRVLTKAQEQLGKSTTFNRKAYDRLQDSIASTRRQTSVLVSATKAQTKAFNAEEFASRGLKDSLKNLARSYLSVFAAIELVRNVGNTVVEIESVKASLLAASGSAKQAAEDFKFIQDVSFALGRDLTVSAKGYQQLGTAARAANLNTEDTKELFLAASEGAVAFGLSVDDTAGVFRAFSQILSKGTVQAEELRGQLGDRLFGAFQLYAESLGVTTEELNDLLKAGEVSSETLIGFAETLRSTARETGALDAGLATIRTGLGQLKSAFTFLITNLFDDTSAIADAFTALADSVLAVTPMVRGLTKVFSVMFSIIGAGIGIIDFLLKAIGIEEGGLGFVISLLVGLLLRRLAPAFVSAGVAGIEAFGAIVTGANASASAVTRLATALTAVKAALRSLLISTGIGALFVLGGIGLEKLFNATLGEDSSGSGKTRSQALEEDIARARQALRDPSSVTSVGSQTTNNSNVSVTNNNTFNTSMDAQDVSRTLENQAWNF